MLYIKDGGLNEPGKGYYWLGASPLPELKSKSITFQAGGKELAVILRALKEYYELVKSLPTLPFHPKNCTCHICDADWS